MGGPLHFWVLWVNKLRLIKDYAKTATIPICLCIQGIRVCCRWTWRRLLRAVVVSSFGKLFLIPAIVWDQSPSAIWLQLTHVLVFSSNVSALRGTRSQLSLFPVADLDGGGGVMGVTTPHWNPIFSFFSNQLELNRPPNHHSDSQPPPPPKCIFITCRAQYSSKKYSSSLDLTMGSSLPIVL